MPAYLYLCLDGLRIGVLRSRSGLSVISVPWLKSWGFFVKSGIALLGFLPEFADFLFLNANYLQLQIVCITFAPKYN